MAGGRVRDHDLAIEVPGGMPKHRDHHGKANEEGQCADHQQDGDNQPPRRHWDRIGSNRPHRGEHRLDRAHVAIEQERE